MKSDNELIAEFMGLKSRVVGTYYQHEVWYKDNPDAWFSFPDYNTWNALMPVVSKIREIVKDLPFGNEYYYALCNALIEVNVHDCHFEVTEFIKWYNDQKK